MGRLSRFGFIQRNKMIILVMFFSFTGLLYFSVLFAFSAFLLFPELKTWLDTMTPQLEHMSEFCTWDFFIFILTNNAAHFCNPFKMLVWIPLLGGFFLGLELGLNCAVIGGALVYASMEKGTLFAAMAVVPHGIFELPAFILQFVCFARWHITIIEYIHAKIIGEKLGRSRVIEGLKDVAIFASLAVTLLVLAALIETFVTPVLLDVVFGESWRM